MNPDSLIQIAQKGLRVTLGATSTLIETLQDPLRREESLSRLRTEFGQLAEEWEVKGEETEREARDFVDNVLSQRFNRTAPPSSTAGSTAPGSPPPSSPPGSAPSTDTTVPPSEVQRDLQDLTEQLAAIRAELQKLREEQQNS
jgi:polyhydroxyalkanoate synthesis regulator phasin